MLDGELIHMSKCNILILFSLCVSELVDLLPRAAFRVEDLQQHTQDAIVEEIVRALDRQANKKSLTDNSYLGRKVKMKIF